MEYIKKRKACPMSTFFYYHKKHDTLHETFINLYGFTIHKTLSRLVEKPTMYLIKTKRIIQIDFIHIKTLIHFNKPVTSFLNVKVYLKRANLFRSIQFFTAIQISLFAIISQNVMFRTKNNEKSFSHQKFFIFLDS